MVSIQSVTAPLPSLYIFWPALFQRDLLTDTRLAGTFGDGTARFAAATAAAAERAAAAAGPKSVPNPAPVKPARATETGVPRGTAAPQEGEGDKEDETTRLAGFLSSVLRGMTDAEEVSEVRHKQAESEHVLHAERRTRTVTMMQPSFTLQRVILLPVNFEAPFHIHSRRPLIRTRVRIIVPAVLVLFTRVLHGEVPRAAFVQENRKRARRSVVNDVMYICFSSCYRPIPT